MSCCHRFLSFHEENSLFPNWSYKTLIIGTFNPIWDFPKASSDYFYSRTRNYFWSCLPYCYGDVTLRQAGRNQKIDYLKRNHIGLTDLIKCIHDADFNNKEHYCLIKSMKDSDLAKFKDIEFNTMEIKNVINKGTVEQVFVTNRKCHKKLESEFIEIERFCVSNGISFERLLTPSGGARFSLKKGSKIEDSIKLDWKGKIKNL